MENEDFFELCGEATITIRFENKLQWQKYRKYILKTGWDFDGGSNPYVAQLPIKFHTVDDIEFIVKKIVQLLQLGFDVYSCQWKMKQNEVDDSQATSREAAQYFAAETSPIMTG